MRLLKWAGLGACLIALRIGATAQEGIPKTIGNHPLSGSEKGGIEESGPYEVVPDHFKFPLPDGWVTGPIAGIHAETPDRIYVYARGMVPAVKEYVTRTGLPARDVTTLLGAGRDMGRREHVLTVYDGHGNLLEDWKNIEDMHQAGSSARRLRVNPLDPEKHLWLVDVGLHQILKVTRDGKVVLKVGPAKTDGQSPREGTAQGYWDIAFLPNGDFWALEGTRAIKFSKDGNQLTEFGRKGTGPGEFTNGRALAIDARGRIYIGDTLRVQVFDQDGKLLDIWPNIRFGAGWLALDKNDRIWVADSDVNKIAGYDLNGKFQYTWGTTGVNPGQLFGVSQFDVDSQGNLYTVEHYGGRVQMFRPKKGADPKHLIAQLVQ